MEELKEQVQQLEQKIKEQLAQIEQLTTNYQVFVQKEEKNELASKQTITDFAEFIQEYGEKVNKLKNDLNTAQFNLNLRQMINPESGFFKEKLSTRLNGSLEKHFGDMVTTAFGEAGVGGAVTDNAHETVKTIVSTVNGAMNLPGIGQAIDSNPYSAIIKEAVSTTSSLVLMVSSAVQNNKRKRLLNQFYGLVPNVKNAVINDLNHYLEFYAKANKFNNRYKEILNVIRLGYETLHAKTVSLCLSIRNALVDQGIAVDIIDDSWSLHKITQTLRLILEGTVNDIKIKPILTKLEMLMKTQCLNLYQEYITLLEEKMKLEKRFLNNFLTLFDDYNHSTVSERVEEIKKSGEVFLEGVKEQIVNDKSLFKMYLKKIYFAN